jgi:hypothetical protein
MEGSCNTVFHTENQPKYAQFQSEGIKDKLNTRALQLAQLTQPSQLVGARSDARSRQRRRDAIAFWTRFYRIYRSSDCSHAHCNPSLSLTIGAIAITLTIQVNIIPGLEL